MHSGVVVDQSRNLTRKWFKSRSTFIKEVEHVVVAMTNMYVVAKY